MMAFSNILLQQVTEKLPSLEVEVIEILNSASAPLSVDDIYQHSKVARTSRDISLLLSQRRSQLNIEISHWAKRPGFRECAFYKIKNEVAA